MTCIALLIGWTMAAVFAFCNGAVVATGAATWRRLRVIHIDTTPVRKILMTSVTAIQGIWMPSRLAVAGNACVYAIDLVMIHSGNRPPGICRVTSFTNTSGTNMSVGFVMTAGARRCHVGVIE